MPSIRVTKEVYYSEYCNKCTHKKTDEWLDPCNQCLTEPMNINSHKPLYFKEEEKQ